MLCILDSVIQPKPNYSVFLHTLFRDSTKTMLSCIFACFFPWCIQNHTNLYSCIFYLAKAMLSCILAYFIPWFRQNRTIPYFYILYFPDSTKIILSCILAYFIPWFSQIHTILYSCVAYFIPWFCPICVHLDTIMCTVSETVRPFSYACVQLFDTTKSTHMSFKLSKPFFKGTCDVILVDDVCTVTKRRFFFGFFGGIGRCDTTKT